MNLLSAAQDDDVKAAVCEAVQAMSPNLASANCFRDLGERGGQSLASTHSPEDRTHVNSSVAGAIPEIVNLLDSTNCDLQEAATQALCGLINRSKPNAL